MPGPKRTCYSIGLSSFRIILAAGGLEIPNGERIIDVRLVAPLDPHGQPKVNITVESGPFNQVVHAGVAQARARAKRMNGS